jgi:hypothetical protein
MVIQGEMTQRADDLNRLPCGKQKEEERANFSTAHPPQSRGCTMQKFTLYRLIVWEGVYITSGLPQVVDIYCYFSCTICTTSIFQPTNKFERQDKTMDTEWLAQNWNGIDICLPSSIHCSRQGLRNDLASGRFEPTAIREAKEKHVA